MLAYERQPDRTAQHEAQAPHALLNLFHCTADNVGDQMSGPSQYLWPDKFEKRDLKQPLPEQFQLAIIGGGQVFSQVAAIAHDVAQRSSSSKVIAWSVGLPLLGQKDAEVLDISNQFSAFSTRNYDWRETLDFVPCASCLSPAFDNHRSPEHEIVVYRHKRKPGPTSLSKTIPTMDNTMKDPVSVVDFIASGETVVTSSYHGVYFAQLLGRKVVCIPYNHKFYAFQHKPTMAEQDNWECAVRSAQRYEPLLEEYRHLNLKFARKVEGIWNA